MANQVIPGFNVYIVTATHRFHAYASLSRFGNIYVYTSEFRLDAEKLHPKEWSQGSSAYSVTNNLPQTNTPPPSYSSELSWHKIPFEDKAGLPVLETEQMWDTVNSTDLKGLLFSGVSLLSGHYSVLYINSCFS